MSKLIDKLKDSRLASSLDVGYDANFNSCGRCVFCKDHLNTNKHFRSSVTNKQFSFGDSSAISSACSTSNVVYLITCNLCKIQYVGMTQQPLRARFSGQRYAGRKGQDNYLLYEHFQSHKHCLSDYKVQIIYHFTGDKSDAKETLLAVEEFYMRILGTLYPFGLNDNINSLKINLRNYDFSKFNSNNTPFFSFSSYCKRPERNHGRRKHKNEKFEPNDFETFIDELKTSFVNYAHNNMYTLLRSKPVRFLFSCVSYLKTKTDTVPMEIHKIILAYYSQYYKVSVGHTKNNVFCIVPFIHKVVENINFNRFLHDKDVRCFLPNKARKFVINSSYTYVPTIGSSIFNYNKVLQATDADSMKSQVCDCLTRFSKFVYSPHKHVHTGNLEIIENIPLRNIMSMGAKFREMPPCNKAKLIRTFQEVVDKLKKKLAKLCHTKLSVFDKWESVLLGKIKAKILRLSQKSMKPNQVLTRPDVINYLNKLHSRFVIVPIDKASNNFAIICKVFYIQVLKGELGVTSTGLVEGNDVYQPVSYGKEVIFEEHSHKLKELGINLDDENRHIPALYWTSKQHKNPFKFRFIAGACKSSTKQISAELALVLKFIKNHLKNYCNVAKRRSGISYYWSIDNSVEFADRLANVKHATSFETFDFSTLYTNLPLDDIFKNLQQLIIKMFGNSPSSAILVNVYTKKAFWFNSGSYNSGYKKYTVDKVLDALYFVLFNSFVQFGGHIFRQVKGIPMGGNASPFIADLYLSWCEFQFMHSLSKADFALARKFEFNSRYLDDIGVINFIGFSDIAKKIYHSTLVLERSDHSSLWDTFLDLFIRIVSNKFVIGIYHKVDDFSFEVISFPFPESNIHSSLGHKTFYSQVKRFYSLCNNLRDFLTRIKILYTKLTKRGYEHRSLYKSFVKCCLKFNIHLKFGVIDIELFWKQPLELEDFYFAILLQFDHQKCC